MTDPPTKAERLAAANARWVKARMRYNDAHQALVDALDAELAAFQELRRIEAEP